VFARRDVRMCFVDGVSVLSTLSTSAYVRNTVLRFLSLCPPPLSFQLTDQRSVVNNGAGGESAIRTTPQRLPSVAGVAPAVGWINAAVAAREAEIQRLERLVGDALYALQKAGLDGEAARLTTAINKR
jgi:hypothetical protein